MKHSDFSHMIAFSACAHPFIHGWSCMQIGWAAGAGRGADAMPTGRDYVYVDVVLVH